MTIKNTTIPASSLPDHAGIGLRGPHYHQVAALLYNDPHIEVPLHWDSVHWLEVHSENFFAKGGANLNYLDKIYDKIPLSFHGVGLSLGSADRLDKTHLETLKERVDRYKPAMVSEHISWSAVDGIFMNDLLPVPYNEASLSVLTDHIKQVQDYLGRQILVENPSSYLAYTTSTMPEADFMAKVVEQAECGILLDVNNIYVSAYNHEFDAIDYINTVAHCLIGEIHLAGHTDNQIAGQTVLIDHHGDVVCEEVWQLYGYAIEKLGNIPTLIEWDTDVPALEVLCAEAHKAEQALLGEAKHSQVHLYRE